MRIQTNSTILALTMCAAFQSVSMSAHAADGCQPVFDAFVKVATTSNHSYTTSTAVSGNTPTESETIIANGQKYIRAHGKWMRTPVTSQDVVEQEKEKQQRGKATCQFLRSESVNGEAAMLYSMHREYEEVKEEGEMWVSQRTGLLLRVEMDVESMGSKVKEHRSARFEYLNIRPPV